MAASPAPNAIAAPSASKPEIVALVAHLSGVMDELLSVIEKETELVRAGRLTEATQFVRRQAI